MPITITVPTQNGPVGPGFTVSGSTSIGPLPVDDYWVVRVAPTTDDNVTIIYGCKPAGGFNTFSVQIGAQNECTIPVTQAPIGLGQGVAAQLVVQLFHANGVQVESLSIPVTWDGSGMLWFYGNEIAKWGATGTAGGGDAKLDQILAAVYRTWPDA